MILGIEREISIFLQAILTGNQVYLAYTAIRIGRRLLPHRWFWISVEDICFWALAGLFVFLKIDQSSDGIIRWYFVLGILLGAGVTHKIVCGIQKKYIAKMRKKE